MAVGEHLCDLCRAIFDRIFVVKARPTDIMLLKIFQIFDPRCDKQQPIPRILKH